MEFHPKFPPDTPSEKGIFLRTMPQQILSEGIGLRDMQTILFNWEHKGLLKVPNEQGNNIYFGEGVQNITKPIWDALQWNPLSTENNPNPDSSTRDPDADPKPAWEWLVDVVTWSTLKGYSSQDRYAPTHMAEHRSAVTDRTVKIDDNTFHVGSGINHMSGLIYQLGQSSEAGQFMPITVLREDDHTPNKLHTRTDVAAIMSKLVDRENRVESAHNTIYTRYQALLKQRDDTSKSFTQRLVHAQEASEFRENYSTHLEAEMANYDPDALPADLLTLRLLYVERLEAVANRRIKYFKGVLTQQGVDLPASCDDEEDAIRKVVEHCRIGSHQILDAADAAAAKTEYDSAVTKINIVSPLNTPVFERNEATITGHELHVKAGHPSGAQILGRVILQSWSIRDANDKPVDAVATFIRTGAAIVTKLKIPSGVAYPCECEFQARNLCGPSTYNFQLTDPSV